MQNRALRLSVVAATLVAFLVLWTAIAAKPWAAASAAARPELDPRLVALNRWERHLRDEAVLVRRTVDRRWAVYRRRLREREAEIATAKRRHAQRLAAARAAEARIAAMQQAALRSGTAPTAQTATASSSAAAAPAPASAPATRIVTLPPKVQVVTLPPASAPVTSSTSSKP